MDLGWVFDTSGFPPRWHCGTWSKALGWTHIWSDLLIFGAYFAIPLLLLIFVVRRPRVPFPIVFWLFMAFILCCGLTHLIEAIIFYEPVYRLSVVMKAITALVSWATVITLVGVIPKALELPALVSDHERLVKEVSARERVEKELTQARSQLEERSAALTLQNRQIHEAMAAAEAVACQWELDSGRIVWEHGLRHWMESVSDERLKEGATSWAELMPEAAFQELQHAARACLDANGMVYAEMSMQRAGKVVKVRFAGAVDPKVAGEPRTVTGLFRLALEVCS